MMAAYVAVLWLNQILIRRFVLKNLKVRSVLTSEKAQFTHYGSRMHAEMGRHPVILGDKGAEFEHIFAANYVDKECRRLF